MNKIIAVNHCQWHAFRIPIWIKCAHNHLIWDSYLKTIQSNALQWQKSTCSMKIHLKSFAKPFSFDGAVYEMTRFVKRINLPVLIMYEVCFRDMFEYSIVICMSSRTKRRPIMWIGNWHLPAHKKYRIKCHVHWSPDIQEGLFLLSPSFE